MNSKCLNSTPHQTINNHLKNDRFKLQNSPVKSLNTSNTIRKLAV